MARRSARTGGVPEDRSLSNSTARCGKKPPLNSTASLYRKYRKKVRRPTEAAAVMSSMVVPSKPRHKSPCGDLAAHLAVGGVDAVQVGVRRPAPLLQPR